MAKEENGTIFVGTKKPTVNYALAIVMTLNNSGKGKTRAVVKARGRAISKAVDAAEIVVRNFDTRATVKNVAIGTEEVGEEKNRVSNIEIVMEKVLGK